MSLTPDERKKETVDAAISEGVVNAMITFVPTVAALAIAMKNPGFVMRTNWQSRTALAVMPALFAFGLTSENSLSHKMHELADKANHNEQTVHWAELQYSQRQETTEDADGQIATRPLTSQEIEQQLADMYLDSVKQSEGNIVPGDKLALRHKVANYVSEHPIKVLASLSLPCVATIFYGQSGKEHLQFSIKLLHTRVFGQFATISLLLGIMGFKEYMDTNGKFITEADAHARVEEMKAVRKALMQRLSIENNKKNKLIEKVKQAHAETVKEHHQRKKRSGSDDNNKSVVQKVVNAAT